MLKAKKLEFEIIKFWISQVSAVTPFFHFFSNTFESIEFDLQNGYVFNICGY